MPMPTLLEHAIDYARRGWCVFPCEQPRAGDATSGKAPIIKNGMLRATTDETQIRAWWTQHPNANIGIATKPSGLIVLDVDISEKKHGDQSLKEIDPELTPTRIARTGSGTGRHLVYTRGENVPRHALHIRDGLDILGNGYFIVAPSRHWSGGTYEWMNDAEPTPAPPILFTLKPIAKAVSSTPSLVAPSTASLAEKPKRIIAAATIAKSFPAKGRHMAFLALAGALASEGWNEEQITEFTLMVAGLIPYENDADREKALRDRPLQARDSVVRAQAGEAVAGWSSFAQFVPEAAITDALGVLGLNEPSFDWVSTTEIKPPLTAIDLGPLGEISPEEIELERARLEANEKGFTLASELALIDYPPVVSYATGFPELDKLLGGGFSTQQLIVLLGKPGAGKTAFAIGRALVMESAAPILYASTELQHNEILARLCSPLLGCPWRDIVRGKGITEDGRKVTNEMMAEVLRSKRVAVIGQDEIYKAGEKAVEFIARTALAMKTHFGVAPIVIVDYLQELARGDDAKARAKNTAVAVAFRMLSQRLDCAFVAISSVSRAGYGTAASALRASDDPTVYLALAKESGDIDYAAATIAFVDVAEEHDGHGWKPGRIAVSKSRHGEVGFAGVRFHGATGRWEAFADGVNALSGDRQEQSKKERQFTEYEERIMRKVTELTAYGPDHLVDKTGLKQAVGGNGQTVGVVIDQMIVAKKLVELSTSFVDAAGRQQKRRIIALGDATSKALAPTEAGPVSIMDAIGITGGVKT